MKRSIMICVGVLAASLAPSVASAYYPYYLPQTGGYTIAPYGGMYAGGLYGGGIYGYMPNYGGIAYGGYGAPFAAGVPLTYGYSYGPVIVNNNVPRNRSRYDEYVGPPARSRSSLYPAVTYSEFAAYEQQNPASSAATTDANRATIIVRLPSNSAKLEINGTTMTQSGTERTFVTPALPSATKEYTFDLKASWTDELGSRTQAATIRVRAGQTYVESFPQQAKQ